MSCPTQLKPRGRPHHGGRRAFGSQPDELPGGHEEERAGKPLLGVLRERRTADSVEQAGELRLPGGEHDRRGPDLGVVPPQGVARKTSAFHLDEMLLGIISRRTDSKLFPLIPFCPRLQALGHGGRSGVEAKLNPTETSHPCHFTRPGGGRHAQSRQNCAQRTDGSISAFS